jgi:predicted NAD-dependent protein-ADP-ribosyltransferase YbiA (DUF1768 family)
VIAWIAEASTIKEARAIAKEYERATYLRPDFRRVNLDIMYDIVFAKFAQNPRLGRWLVDTDPEGEMPPIFHIYSDKFFGIGDPITQESEPALLTGQEPHGGILEKRELECYHGNNFDGQILMCVREELRQHYKSLGPRHRVQPAAVLKEGLRVNFETLEGTLKHFNLLQDASASGGSNSGMETPLPKNTLIDKRYRVEDHRCTIGLGSYTGQFSYICTDEAPLAATLENRIRALLQRTVCAPLQRALLQLQSALCCLTVSSADCELTHEWERVRLQVFATALLYLAPLPCCSFAQQDHADFF